MSRDNIQIDILPIQDKDRPWVSEILRERWGSEYIVSRGKVHYAGRQDGFLALLDGAYAGLATHHIEKDECELLTLDSLHENLGIGTRLIKAVTDCARKAGCKRLWLITTNDNTPAMEFYQKRGFHMVKVHKDAIRESRRLKPEIPEYGINSIPIKDEIEFEILLT